ncbi:MAG TPA: DUF1501 domain-containing protein [Actinophytocola sp.]|uniref:DUF1501 domain-containing protein n=1 Tax=Actinophytocola sp. TaxID=1872138 RepID=UPI002DDD7C0D|nr:DUF1501 domain-containing protein [Actinophytocola sp.]HEV2783094.1 DUF1501 domain-containing protein [Actinophytocola sp.]
MSTVDKVTRRRFLTMSGVTAAGTLAAGATQVNWMDLLTAAQRDPLAPGAGVLVVVTLYGGNDGLNTVIPAADPAYQDARHELAYQPEEVLDLGEGLGLNPGMAGMKKLWDARKLAIVRGVGYPEPDHSHFRSMAIWQTASPDRPATAGWLGRWLDATGDDPMRALSVEPTLPPLLAGERVAGASLPESGLRLPTGPLGEAFLALGAPQPGEAADAARAARSIADLREAARLLGEARARQDEEPPEDEERTKGASAGGRGALGAQLDLVATLIEAALPTRAYSVSLGGFDTHADERGTQQRLLTELDAALSGFVERMQRTDRGRAVVVLVYSEFGRRVRANASHGTDHGTAGPAFLLGERIRGGFHGRQPGLTDLVDGDLKETTDFRDIYATLLAGVLDADAGRILADHPGRLDGVLAG